MIKFGGFWIRLWANIIDSVLFLIIAIPVTYLILNSDRSLMTGPVDVFVNWILPAVVVIVLWSVWTATPGKMLTGLSIVDQNTLRKGTKMQYTIRYFAMFLSIIPLGLGCLWIAWDRKKQGWHDKIAGTVVLKQSHSWFVEGYAPRDSIGHIRRLK